MGCFWRAPVLEPLPWALGCVTQLSSSSRPLSANRPQHLSTVWSMFLVKYVTVPREGTSSKLPSHTSRQCPLRELRCPRSMCYIQSPNYRILEPKVRSPWRTYRTFPAPLRHHCATSFTSWIPIPAHSLLHHRCKYQRNQSSPSSL
jgi:hypothetical protein